MTDPKANQRSALTLLLLFGGLFLLFFGLVVSAATLIEGGSPVGGPSVGVVELTGVIDDPRQAMEAIRDFAEDSSINGIIIRVDSPGGSVGPAQEIYREVVKAKARKKVVASLGAVAASGGYYAICGANKIVANPGTITGSIGVITEVAHMEEVLSILHISTETFKSGELKDSGSLFRPVSPADRLLFEGMVRNVHEQFQRTVQKERNLTEAILARIRDGRVLTGEQAKTLGLVDELGNLHDAVGYLQVLAGFEGTPRLVYPSKKTEELIREMLDRGIGSAVRALMRNLGSRMEYRLPSMY
jgi:protease-4